MSERLARAGRIGAEVLSGLMDRCFTGLIDALAPLGGDVLFVAFTAADHARRGVAGAVAMRRALAAMGPLETPLGAVRITMSLGVAAGPADVVVGDGPQRPSFLVGPTVTRTIGMEAAASSGQILVDEPTATAIGPAACRPAGPGARGPCGPGGPRVTRSSCHPPSTRCRRAVDPSSTCPRRCGRG